MQSTVQTALVVDDSRLARIALSKLLQKRNVTVAAVDTGSAALDYLRDDRPDVVFMDYMMPDMDGFEAIRRIRNRYAAAELPVVMYTSQDSDEDRERAHELGISAFLIKPSGEDNLNEVLTLLSRQLADRPAPGAAVAEAGPEPVRAPEAPSTAATPAAVPEPEPEPPEPAEAAPASPPPAAATEVPWDEIRETARAAATEAAAQSAGEIVRGELEPLRRQLAGTVEQANASARKVAEQAAAEAAEAIADQAARAIAQKVAEDAAARMAEDIGPETARRILSELRRDIRDYMAELLISDAFREQISGVVADAALPRLKEAIQRESLPPLREELLHRANSEAASSARSIAIRAATETVEELAVQFRKENETHIRELAAEQTRGLRRGLWAVVIVGLVLVGVSLVLGLGGASLLA